MDRLRPILGMLRFECKDAGFDCKAVFLAKTEEELNNQIGQHAIDAHGLEASDFAPELMRKVKASIRRS
jgi:predicted small metal-binding protein